MFDELQKEPEDVFAQTDANAPQIIPPTMQAAPQPVVSDAPQPAPEPQPVRSAQAAMTMADKPPFPWKVVALVVGIIAVITIAFFLSMKILNSKTPVTPKEPAQTQAPAPEASAPAVQIPQATTSPETAAPAAGADETLDSDKDGLTDVREAQLGTDPHNPDTDGDGLFDKEEVDVYHTNPLNPDTDGDGFKDGDEVKNGYNPNGPGKLLQVPQK